RHRASRSGCRGPLHDRPRRRDRRHPGGAELWQCGVRCLRAARCAAREPAAAAAGALRQGLRGVPHDVRADGAGWRVEGMRLTRRVLVLVLLLGGRGMVAHAVVTGTIFGPGSETFPIAVMPLKDLGGDSGGSLGARFASVLTRDFELSG